MILVEKKNELLNKIAEILDEKEINMTDKITENTFDSLGILALSAAIDDVYDVVVPVANLRRVSTIEEIFKLVEDAENE